MIGRYSSPTAGAAGMKRSSGVGGLHLTLSRENKAQTIKALFTVQSSVRELWKENTQAFCALCKTTQGYVWRLILNYQVMEEQCHLCWIFRVACMFFLSGYVQWVG